MRSRGFTLLEVMVAVTILGLGLTMVLTSQAGLLGFTWRVRNQAHADVLIRCKMSELEVQLLREGYQLTDVQDEGECCENADQDAYKCSWKIEKVELPQPGAFAESSGETKTVDGASSSEASDGKPPKPGASGMPTDGPLPMGSADAGMMGNLPPGLGAYGAMQKPGGSMFGDSAFGSTGSGSGAGMMSAFASGGGIQGMVSALMGVVYPTLKPMLEASIRRLTVTIEWQESGGPKTLTVVQFVTNPTQGGMMNDMQVGAIQGAMGAADGSSTSSSSSNSSGAK